jgi:hypothetical protein
VANGPRRSYILLELREDLGRLGEAFLGLLREEQHVARVHVELALLAGDRCRGASRLCRYLGRETRGPSVVTASDGAEENADVAHPVSVPNGMWAGVGGVRPPPRSLLYALAVAGGGVLVS